MPLQAALLRGINVGSARRISMPDLRDALAAAGLPGARTYVQSGNIVMASELSADRLAAAIDTVLAGKFGLSDVPVVIRTEDELARIVKLDPLRAVATADKLYQVSFLSEAPPSALAARLADAMSEPEQFVIDGREIYSWHPRGSQNSKLWRLLADRRLGVTATARNWTTVRTLLEMMQS